MITFPSRRDDYSSYYLEATKILMDFLKKNSWARHYFDMDLLKEFYEADLTPILYSERNDFFEYINTTYKIRDNMITIWEDMQSALTKYGGQDPRYLRLYELAEHTTDMINYIDTYYQRANSITFLVPFEHFENQPVDLKDITPLLKQLEALKIECVLVNVQNNMNGEYAPCYIELCNTHKPCRAFTGTPKQTIFNGKYIHLDKAPEEEEGEKNSTHLWLLNFIDLQNTFCHHYKQLFLKQGYDDYKSNYTKMSKVELSIPSQYPEDILLMCRMINRDISEEQIFNDKNVRWFKMKEVTGEEKNSPALRLPAAWVLSQDDKYLMSSAFQAISAFINRKTVYKDAPTSERNSTLTNDIVVIDGDNVDSDKEEPYIRTLTDIVRYEQTNGTVFKTHHASPRRHWVRGYDRYLNKSGKTVQVTGHWRGKDNKEVIYQLPKRKRN